MQRALLGKRPKICDKSAVIRPTLARQPDLTVLTSIMSALAGGLLDKPEEMVEPRCRPASLLVFYCIAASIDLAVACVVLPYFFPEPKSGGPFGWHFIHFTTWGEYTQIGYFIVAIIDTCLFLRANSRGDDFDSRFHRRFHAHRDRYFGFAFATASFISFGYWIVLYPISPVTSPDYNVALTICEHGVTLILICIELCVRPHEYVPLDDVTRALRARVCCCCGYGDTDATRDDAGDLLEFREEPRSHGSTNYQEEAAAAARLVIDGIVLQADAAKSPLYDTSLVVVYFAVYEAWNLTCHAINGSYAYSVQAMLPLPVAIIAYIMLPFSLAGFHMLGNLLNGKLWIAQSIDSDEEIAGFEGRWRMEAPNGGRTSSIRSASDRKNSVY